MDDLKVALGLALVLLTFGSMVSTFVLPRGSSATLQVSRVVTKWVRLLGALLARLVRKFERREGLLAAIAPVALLTQLVVFLALLLVGFGVALWPYASSFPDALELSASSLFTATLAHVHGPGNSAIEVMAAVTGAVAIALQVGYLPALYQAFNRRESLVTLMESRAGVPAFGPELLIRHQLISSLDALADLYREWEQWAADLAESHVSYPILLLFRSPEPGFSFILSLLAVMDAAALHLSLCPGEAPNEARFCLRMGFTALRRIAQMLGWPYDPDPRPDGEIRLEYGQFADAVAQLESVGFPVRRSPEEAWADFRGWRVNYEENAYRLCQLVLAPQAPWSGTRRGLHPQVMRPERPRHRSPFNTEG